MKKLLIMLAAVLLTAPAFAQTGALKLSLWDNIAVAVPNDIQHMKGAELGIASRADTFRGAQFDLLLANTTEEMTGWSSALITVHHQMKGVQAGLVNYADDVQGLQFGGINVAQENFSGLQLGIYNAAGRVKGLQLGIINVAQNIQGLQIGVINIANNGWFPAMILINGRF